MQNTAWTRAIQGAADPERAKHYFERLKSTEIAATLGIPVGTVQSRLHYAVRQLRTVLDADGRVPATHEERPA